MSQEHNPNSHEESHSDHTGPTVVFFVIFGLFMGAVMREINKKTRIPYTPLLLVLGITLGFLKNHLGIIGQSTSIIQKLNPHMILLIFIPVLLFQSAFNCDWYVFRKSMANILILAAPGVLWGAILIGCCFKLILMYPDSQLTWYEAFTLGCVLSATDPVAVVALLKQLGASVRFNTLVEGESLMNDGTAMVFFMLFMDLVKGNTSSALGVMANFVRIAIGGPILGVIFGFALSFWMKRIIRDPVLSINITFVGAYLCFYVAEFTFVKVSGILAVVVLGLYMSAVGRVKIYPESEHALHNVWAYIQYSCQTLIFILTGIVVGVEMINGGTIGFWDWVRMFIFWVLMIIVRAIMVLTFYPLLKRTGYGLSKKQMVVLIYGGLRGALGMCLSLIIGFDDKLSPRFRELTVFYMCGMAMLTIIVNGLTCGKIVDYVQMITYPQIKRKLLKRSINLVLEETKAKLKQLKNEPNLAYANWRQVEDMAQVTKLGTTKLQRSSNASKMDMERDSLVSFKKTDMVAAQVRFRFTRYLHKIYWDLYEEGELSQGSITLLSNSCDIVNDDCGIKLNYFEVLSQNFTMGSLKYYFYFKDTPIIGKYITRNIVNKVYETYEISCAFVDACEQAIHVFKEKFPIKNHESVLDVLKEVDDNVELAISYIAEVQNVYSTIIQAVHTSKAVTVLLKNKKHSLHNMLDEGFIDESDYNSLRKEIDIGLVQIQIHDFKLQQVRFNEVLTQCPLFASLSPTELANLRKKSVEKSFQKNTVIQQKEKQMRSVLLVISGTVKENFQNFSMVRGLGSLLNPYNFTYKQKSQCQIIATTKTRVMQIPQNAIWELLQKYSEFKKKWYKGIFYYSLKFGKAKEFLQKNLSEKQVRRYVENSEVKIFQRSQSTILENGGYIFEGEVQSNNNTYTRGSYISQKRQIKILKPTIILQFRDIGEIKVQNERYSVINDDKI